MLGLRLSTLPSAGSTTTVTIPAGIHNGNGGVTVSYSGGNVVTAIPAGIHNGNGYITVNGEQQETQLTLQTWYTGNLNTGRDTYKGRQDCIIGTLYKFIFDPTTGPIYGFGGVTGGTIVSTDTLNNIIVVRATAAKVGFVTQYQERTHVELFYNVTAMYRLS